MSMAWIPALIYMSRRYSLLQGLKTGMVEAHDLPQPGRLGDRSIIKFRWTVALSAATYADRSELHIECTVVGIL